MLLIVGKRMRASHREDQENYPLRYCPWNSRNNHSGAMVSHDLYTTPGMRCLSRAGGRDATLDVSPCELFVMPLSAYVTIL